MAACLVVLISRPCAAIPVNLALELTGSYKNISQYTRTYLDSKQSLLSLSRLRAGLRLRSFDRFRCELVYDNELALGSYLHSADFRAAQNAPVPTYWDGERTIMDNRDLYWRHSLYRAFLAYQDDPFIITAGRQRIAWGKTRLWVPLDIFNPVDPLAIEQSEKAGVDAFRGEYALPGIAAVECVLAPQPHTDRVNIAARGTITAGTNDLEYALARMNRDVIAGLGWDGYAGNAGVRAALVHTHADEPFPGTKESFWRAVAGADYRFASSLYVLAEYLYNGSAAGNDALAASAPSYNQIVSMNTSLAGVALSYELTPLVVLSQTLLWDPKGSSAAVSPAISWSMTANTALASGAQFFIGPAVSEFGSNHALLYCQYEWFF